MFDLEKAVAEWRREMLADGIKTPVPLEELESHLREGVEQQLRLGLSPEEAFTKAVMQVGKANPLKKEFEKINHTKQMKKVIIVGLGIIGVMVGMALVMPAVAQYRNEGALLNDEPVLLVVGTVLTLGGVGAAVMGVRTRKA
jgi:hypothetical protein